MRRFLWVGVATAALCVPAMAGGQMKSGNPDRQSQGEMTNQRAANAQERQERQEHQERPDRNAQDHWALSSGQVADAKQALKDVQQELNDRGFDAGRADGLWGPQTANAVERFQHDNEIQASGKLDDATIEKLGLNFATNTNRNEPSTTGSGGGNNEPSTTGSGGSNSEPRGSDQPDDTRSGPDVPKSPSGDDISD